MGYSEFFDQRRQTWSDPQALVIWERYQTLYALTDFFSAFKTHPEFQSQFSGTFEQFGRSMGLGWVFDQTRCPEELKPYLDLLIEPIGVYLTIVPEGCFSFHPAIGEGSWGLVYQGWEEVLDVTVQDYHASRVAGNPASLRYRRLIKLLEGYYEQRAV